jgi:hypothetical protein
LYTDVYNPDNLSVKASQKQKHLMTDFSHCLHQEDLHKLQRIFNFSCNYIQMVRVRLNFRTQFFISGKVVILNEQKNQYTV